MRRHYETDRDTFAADAYIAQGKRDVAWHVLGWETEPDEDTEWSGMETRTGRVVAVMVGDDRCFTFDEDELAPLDAEDFCDGCGQIGCGHGSQREG